MVVKKKSASASAPKNNSKFAALKGKIKPVSDLGLTIAALFYGRAGTGKTTLASTFPGPILHIDVREKGTDSIADLTNVDTIPLEDWDQFEQIYWFLKSGDSGYKTVIIDPVSQLQDFAISEAMRQTGKQEGAMMSKREWGITSGLMKTWIINYRDLVDEDINVIFLAHDRANDGEEGDEGELMPSVGPRLMPSVASMLNGAVKLIGNTFIKEHIEKRLGGKPKRTVTYCLRIGPHSYYATKLRQPKGSYLPDIIENPDYNVLVSLMKGEFKAPAEKPESVKKLLKRK